MKNMTLSSTFQSGSQRGCTLVVNLKPVFSLASTAPAGIEAFSGETILQIPVVHKHLIQETDNSTENPNHNSQKRSKSSFCGAEGQKILITMN